MNNIKKSTFLKSNETKYRLLRTIVQGIIGVIIANLDLIISGIAVIPPQYKAMIVALVMAVLSPIMSELGAAADEEEKDETDYIADPGYPEYYEAENIETEDPEVISAEELEEEEAE